MSWEAWEDDDAKSNDELLPEGWWDEDTVGQVIDAIKALKNEPVYEDGKKENGISPRFFARITMIEEAAGMKDCHDPWVMDAKRLLVP